MAEGNTAFPAPEHLTDEANNTTSAAKQLGEMALANSEAELPCQAIEDIDPAKIAAELTTLATETYRRYQALGPSHALRPRRWWQREREDDRSARETIQDTYQRFAAEYINEDGEPRKEAIQDLSGRMASRIEIISIDEMKALARAVVDQNTSGTIVLYVSKWELPDGDLGDPESSNSNAFMAKLVREVGLRGGKKIKIVTDLSTLENEREIYYVDDAVYSGYQASSRNVEIAPHLRPGTQLKIYTARATRNGLAKIRQSIDRERKQGVNVYLHSGGIISSFADQVRNDRSAQDFFLARGVIPALESGETPSEALNYAERYLMNTGLTATAARTPDDQSFPYFISAGLPLGRNERHYPRIDSLFSDRPEDSSINKQR